MRLMVTVIAESVGALFNGLLLAGLMTYVTALALMMVAVSRQDEYDPARHDRIIGSYGGVGKSMATLLRAVTGSDLWGEPFHAAGDIASSARFLYIAYAIFCTVVLLNIFTAVIVERTMRRAGQYAGD